MSDYQPVNLSKFCNVGANVIDQEPVLGNQMLRGLPFLVGNERSGVSTNCFIHLKEGDAPIDIPIGKRAQRIIVAH